MRAEAAVDKHLLQPSIYSILQPSIYSTLQSSIYNILQPSIYTILQPFFYNFVQTFTIFNNTLQPVINFYRLILCPNGMSNCVSADGVV